MAKPENIPTVVPAADFDAVKDANALNDAFKGFGISVFRVGTKDDVIISIWTKRSCAQRQKIQQAYKEKFKKDLIDGLKSELSGNYLQIMEDMLDQPILLKAKRINKIIKTKIRAPGSCGADIELLEIIYSLPKQELNSLMLVYQDAFQVALVEDVKENVDGEFKDTVLTILQGGRSKDEPSQDQITADAQLLSKLQPAEWSPENEDLMKIFLSPSVYIFYLFTVLRANEEKSLLEVAKTETDEKYRDGFVTMVNAANGVQSYHADLLYQAMKGLGTKDEQLIYLILTHCETDLGNIEKEFLAKYSDSLQNFIRDDTGGEFQQVLLALCSPEEDCPSPKAKS